MSELSLSHLSLFSGIGGIDLSAEWAGFETVGQCEWADYPTKILEKHWPDVPRWRDIRTLNGENFYERTGLQTVDIISGGFPCQPFSVAGKQGNKEDDRYLWPEMLRVISILRPKWVIGENVAGLLSIDEGRTFATIIKGLESANYKVMPIVSTASNYGASFEGKRVFIIATSESCGHRRSASEKLCLLERKLVEGKQERDSLWGKNERCIIYSIRHQEARPDCLRSNYGFPDWLDRIKCLGNAVVPQQVYPILKSIAEIEKAIICEM
jgi:DNA (cytosine-5)-methyltransferase 1